MENSRDFIDREIKENDIVLFMKGSKDFPKCGFSQKVAAILDRMGCIYKAVDVLSSNSLREDIKEYSNWPTLPQLYVKGVFIGGCDIVQEMFQTNELHELFEKNRIDFKENTFK